jgi:hypothetical protein
MRLQKYMYIETHLYGPIIVKVCSICHLAYNRFCWSRIFHVFAVDDHCGFCAFMFNFICLLSIYVLSCKSCIRSYCHVFEPRNIFKPFESDN